MSRQYARQFRQHGPLAVWLAWIGGFVDGVGYLVLFRMFTSHMSGNTVAAGVAVGTDDWHTAFHRGFPIPLFFLGVCVGAALGEILARAGFRSRQAVAFGLEALLLAGFMTGGISLYRDGMLQNDNSWAYYGLAALPALAMGLQNATLRQAGGMALRTTFITGILTNCAELAVGYFFWLRDHAVGPRKRPLFLLLRLSPRQASFVQGFFLFTVWTCYLGGAFIGAWAHGLWALMCLVIPLVALLVLILFDLVYPLPGPEPRPR